jgi:hypothetical protein
MTSKFWELGQQMVATGMLRMASRNRAFTLPSRQGRRCVRSKEQSHGEDTLCHYLKQLHRVWDLEESNTRCGWNKQSMKS